MPGLISLATKQLHDALQPSDNLIPHLEHLRRSTTARAGAFGPKLTKDLCIYTLSTIQSADALQDGAARDATLQLRHFFSRPAREHVNTTLSGLHLFTSNDRMMIITGLDVKSRGGIGTCVQRYSPWHDVIKPESCQSRLRTCQTGCRDACKSSSKSRPGCTSRQHLKTIERRLSQDC